MEEGTSSVGGIPGYGKVRVFGTDRSHQALLGADVRVEEKIDGSQLSFALGEDGKLVVRSRRQLVWREDGTKALPAGLFGPTVQHLLRVKDWILPATIYRGEALCKPKHNVLAYERAPRGHLVLWSVETVAVGSGNRDDILYAAEKLDVEPVPLLGEIAGLRSLDELLPYVQGDSVLGGPREGIVVKAGDIKAKIVDERFQEVAKQRQKKPKGADDIWELGRQYGTEARWAKARQHLAEEGKLTGTPRDIGLLVREVQSDVFAEGGDELRDAAWNIARPRINKSCVDGLAQWYKAELQKENL